MLELVAFIISAVFIERIVEVVKEISPWELSPQALRAFSVALGILFAINFSLDLLAVFGLVGSIELVGSITTGCIIGSGSGFVHDTIDQLRNEQEQ